MSGTLVFSFALNGYQWRYGELLKTHQAYCDRYGYRYIAVTKPRFSLLGLEVAWLKIQLINEALQAGYSTVAFFDADTRVAENAPSLNWVEQSNKDIWAAKGFSGRYNSGVLCIKNTSASRHFFSQLLESSPLTKERIKHSS